MVVKVIKVVKVVKVIKVIIGVVDMLLSSNGKYEIDSNNKMLPFIFDISRKHLYYITSNNLNVLRDLLKDRY